MSSEIYTPHPGICDLDNSELGNGNYYVNHISVAITFPKLSNFKNMTQKCRFPMYLNSPLETGK